MKPLHPQSLVAAGLLLSFLPALPVGAQTIPNPSFETDTFTVFPGYVSGNGPITGWTGAFPESHGLNPSSGSPFANNGAVPDGSKAAFIQSNSNFSTLETTITGLTPGTAYQLTFRATARNPNVPQLDLRIDGNSLVTSAVTAVGGANPYTYISAYYTPLSSTAALQVVNTANNDNTLVVDNFTIAATTQPWTSNAWTDDASTGIDRAFIYTHAYNFGSAANFTINSVPFKGLAGTNPSDPGKLTMSGFTGLFNNDGNNLGGESRAMANDFIYNGFPGNITLSGLVPGRAYVLSLYSMGWEGPNGRWITFRSGNEVKSFDQDVFDNDNGHRIDFSYIADATGTLSIFTHPLGAGSFHLYGLANRETTAPVVPVFASQPENQVKLTGETAVFFANAAGAPPLSYQWYRNGVLLPGETLPTLTIAVTSAASQSGKYAVRATNGGGFTDSNTAFLEVFEPVTTAGTFNTGVDPTNVPLFGGDIDPHYTLIQNPDGLGEPTTYVQTGIPGAWLPNTLTASWIGPSASTATAAGPIPSVYIYRTGFDLTGVTPVGVLTGSYASDNVGLSVRLNTVPIPGMPQSTTFAALTPFVVRTENLAPGTLVAGANTLDFEVDNAGVGPTGLLVDNLHFSQVPAGIAPSFVVTPTGGTIVTGTSVTLSARAYGTGNISYQWLRNGTPLPGQTGQTYTISSFSSAQNGNYTVTATNALTTVTSPIATLTASNVPPGVTADPQSLEATVGQSVTFSFAAEGSTPFSYQWLYNGANISGATSETYTIGSVTRANAGRYSVKVTNAYGDDTSAEAVMTVFNGVPGLYNTGIDDTGTVLADSDFDPHYVLSPGTPEEAVPVVHLSTVFPIVNGPWFANNSQSKWITPIADSVTGGAGDFVYRLNFDLTGLYPPSVRIMGAWATDNVGVALRVNGTDTGLVNNAQFPSLTSFSISAANAAFHDGINTLDFVVNNSEAGYTGLRVQGIRGLAEPAPNLPPLTITLNGSGQPVISFTGVQGTSYGIQRSTTLTPSGSWSVVGTVVGGAGGAVTFTDSEPPAGRAFYRAEIPLTPP
ncbi:MAG: Endoglucanase [Verrucomicrobiales bacterium]|nr:Endoglucanase [Verrucomicrobiales bacterium]